MRSLYLSLPLLPLVAFSPAIASDAPPQQESAPQQEQTNDGTGNYSSDIVVTATRLRGAVESDIAPIEELNEDDINALGASSITDVLTALAPQTSSGRGRGGGAPIVLLNGQRVSSFRELRNIPPEAIRQVQVFPEELALQYGYRPDQRVINFILKDNFASVDTEAEIGAPQDGGYTKNEFEVTLTSIGKTSRLSINAEYERQDLLTQADRGVTDDSDNSRFIFDGDINDFRTLRPETDRMEVNGTYSKVLAPQTNLSFNANYQVLDSMSLLGLPSADLLLPGSSPFSPDGNDLIISRYFNSPRPLERSSTTHSANFSAGFNSLIGAWRWALTADYARIDGTSITTGNADFSALQTGLTNGSVDPFADSFGSSLSFLQPEIANSLNQNLNLLNTFSGALFDLPAGPVQATFSAGYIRQTQDSETLIANISTSANLRRNLGSGAISLDIPLVERGAGLFGFLGDISLSGNYTYNDVSDFGGLNEYTAGIRWAPFENISFQATWIGDENAPSISSLGNPIQITPNTTFFDFTRNETVLIDVISGGNPALVSERRRDLKLSANWQPQGLLGMETKGLDFQIEYFRNRSYDTTNSFPLLTPEIEAAFPGRVIRDTNGQLLRVDQRPVNFDETRSQSIRWGFNFSGGIGEQERGGRPDGARQGGGRTDGNAPDRSDSGAAGGAPPQNAGGRRPGGPGAGGPGGGRGGFGGRRPGRWQIALYHSYQIQDEILIAPGVPVLDLLDGSATSALGGTPQHRVELSGGIFNKGLGMRIEGNYRSPTRADGTGLVGSSDLRFSDLTSLNLRFFVNLDDRGNLTQKFKFLKGARISLRVDNVFNDIIDVRDENGLVPLRYQPAFLDPVGRFFEVSFRKRF